MEQTLLLNASYEPLKIVHWQKAITLLCQGKVEVIAEYDREIRSVSISFRLPSVIRLLRYIKMKRRFDYVPFSRANIRGEAYQVPGVGTQRVGRGVALSKRRHELLYRTLYRCLPAHCHPSTRRHKRNKAAIMEFFRAVPRTPCAERPGVNILT